MGYSNEDVSINNDYLYTESLKYTPPNLSSETPRIVKFDSVVVGVI